MFTIRGKINGFVQTIIWDPSHPRVVIATPVTMDRLNRLVGKPVNASPTGPEFIGAFEPDYVAYVTICNVFDQNFTKELLQGEHPEIPGFQLPPGAVG